MPSSGSRLLGLITTSCSLTKPGKGPSCRACSTAFVTDSLNIYTWRITLEGGCPVAATLWLIGVVIIPPSYIRGKSLFLQARSASKKTWVLPLHFSPDGDRGLLASCPGYLIIQGKTYSRQMFNTLSWPLSFRQSYFWGVYQWPNSHSVSILFHLSTIRWACCRSPSPTSRSHLQ